MARLVTELFPQFCEDQQFMDVFGNALVEKVVDDRMKSCITITFRSAAPISRQHRKMLCSQLKDYFPDRQKLES